MPIQPPHFDGSVVLRSKSAFPGHHGQPYEDANPDDHVERVQAGHDEVESKEDLRVARIGVLVEMSGNRNISELEARARHMMLLELFLVLDPFDSEERRAEHQGREQVATQQLAPAGLCCPDCQHYGQAAADKNRSVGCAQGDIEGLAGRTPVSEIPATVHQVSTEQTAKKHDLAPKKYTH